MKIRTDYVSNSSSSSFIVAYDPKFYGDLTDFIKSSKIGYNTSIQDIKDFFEDYESMEESWREKQKQIKGQIEECKKNKKNVLYFWLDYECRFFIEFMEYLNSINDDTFEIIYEGD